MNKHSIIRLISSFFLFIFILINILFWITHEDIYQKQEIEQLRRFMLADRLLHNHSQDFSFELKQLMIQASPLSPQTVLAKGNILMELPFGKMVRFQKQTYFVKEKPHAPPEDFKHFDFLPPPLPHDSLHVAVLQDIQKYSFVTFWLILFGVDMLIVSFYIYIIRKLFPLHKLKNAISAFKEGDEKLDIVVHGEDEISQITQEFNTTLEKIASMREARSLFLRNILHELKTPIMKGSLTAECIQESDEQERLKRIFKRMDYLLNEFAKMENFSSGEWKLNIQEYRFVDLLDHSCDMLLCSKESFTIIGEELGVLLHVDFDLFTIALKNLLDNALKYSSHKPRIHIDKMSIEICSKGEPLAKEKQNFTKPFNRDFEDSSSGLGLGLYISHSILNKQKMKLSYRYTKEHNCFKIEI